MFNNLTTAFNHETTMYLLLTIGIFLYAVFLLKIYKEQFGKSSITISTPPLNLSPAIMRYLLQKKTDNKLFLSAILYLAQQGFITIDKKMDKFCLNKTKKDIMALQEYERKLLECLFEKNDSLIIANENVNELINARKNFKQKIMTTFENKYFLGKFYYQIFLLIPALIIFSFALYLNHTTLKLEIMVKLLMMIFIIRRVFYFVPNVYQNLSLYQHSISGIRVIVGTTIFLISVIVFPALLIYIYFGDKNFVSLMTLAWLFFITLTFYSTKLLNKEGVDLLHQIKNFKLFILNQSAKIAKNNNALELAKFVDEHLPYAVALNIENKLINNLNSMMRNNLPSFYCPTWYSVQLRKYNFANSITQDFLPSLNEPILKDDLFWRSFPG